MEKQLGQWPVSVSIPVLWGHMDAFNHVNNVMYLRWFESARIAFFEAADVIGEMERTGVGPILGRATCDYRIPLTYPDQLTVQTTVTSLGTSSFVMQNRVLCNQFLVFCSVYLPILVEEEEKSKSDKLD